MSGLIIGLIVVNIAVLVVTRVLKKQAAATDEGISVEASQAALTRGREERFELIARIFTRKGRKSIIERNLVTAGLALKPTEFFAVNVVVLIVVMLLGLWYISTMPAYDSLFGFVKRLLWLLFFVWIGWKGPQMVLQFMANQRRSKLEYQLADALAIIASGLKGGYTFIQGVDMASQQMESPITEEFTRVLRLIQLGLDTPRALEQMAERVNSYDYNMTISATNIQLSAGGNLAQLLEGIAETIRDRIRLRRDIAALTAQGRASGGILIALPIGIAIMLRIINPEYMGLLTDTEMGNNILYVAIGQQLVGILWIKKLLDFDN